MRKLLLCIVFTFLYLQSQEVVRLEAKSVLPIEVENTLEPSGLTIWQQKFLTVDDKTNDTIFKIVIHEQHAEIKPFLKIQIPPILGKMDFEGITHDGENLYLASEAFCKVLRVNTNGNSQWINIPFYEEGSKLGLFQTHNARIEGITVLTPNHILVAAERQPRGLVEAQISPPKVLHCQLMDEQNVSGLVRDFSGLCYHQGVLWAIFRNAHQIVRLDKVQNNYTVTERYDFSHILLSSQYRYNDMEFGIAEGLAVDDNFFYVVVDNNRMHRQQDVNDTRPLFLVLHKPPLK